jgi:foldase protein PrsA
MKQYHQDMKGKIILNLKKIGLIAVTGVAAVTLAACGQDGANSDIVTMKGDTIRVSDLYKRGKTISIDWHSNFVAKHDI